MKLTGHASSRVLSGAEEDGTRERAEDNAGGVRVELRVRQIVIDGIWPSLMKKWQNQQRPYR